MRSKAEYFYERLQITLNNNLMIAPLSVDIDLTNVCHQACYYCNSEQFRVNSRDRATKEDYIRLISKLLPKTNDITFTGGGEPLDNPDAAEIMMHALKRGFKIGIITNGVRLWDLQSKFNQQNYPSWIGVDFDSGNQKDYWRIRKSSLSKVVASVEEVIDELKSFGTKMTFKYLINDYNNSTNQIDEAVQLASKIGFDEFYVRVAYFPDHIIHPPGDNWWELEKHIIRSCNEVGIRYLGSFAKQEDFLKLRGAGSKPVLECFAPLFVPAFTADGSIYWCCEYRGDNEYIIGNWIKDGIEPLYRQDLINRMKSFIKYHRCARPCRYYTYNLFVSKINAGLDQDDGGHTVGFF